MFSIGQKVWHRTGQRSGTVLECVGNRVFIAQENGAELDFPASDLTATPPTAGKPPAAAPQSALLTRTLTSRDITPLHTRVLGAIPVRTLQAVASLYERRAGAKKFSALNTAEKLNVIAEITAVPYRTMQAHADSPGELGLLMGKGLADSQKK